MRLLVIFVRVNFFLEPGRAWVVPLCNRAKCYPVAQPDASVCGLRIGGRPVAQLDVPTQSVLRQCQYSLPIGDLNPNNKGHTRCIVIPFFEHSDKSNTTALYEELNTSRDKVSAPVREIHKRFKREDIPTRQQCLHTHMFASKRQCLCISSLRLIRFCLVWMLKNCSYED